MSFMYFYFRQIVSMTVLPSSPSKAKLEMSNNHKENSEHKLLESQTDKEKDSAEIESKDSTTPATDSREADDNDKCFMYFLFFCLILQNV